MRPLYLLSLQLLLICLVIDFSNAQNVIFKATFDDTLISSEGESPTSSSNVNFTNGFSQSGLDVDTGHILKYNIANNIMAEQGSMTVWIKPNWQPGGILYRILVVESSPVFEVHVDEGSSIVFAMFSDQIETRVFQGNVSHWTSDDWHFLGFNWSADKIEVFIDGIKLGELPVGYMIPGFGNGTFNVGSLNGENSFNGIIDELTIYDSPMSVSEMNQKYQTELSSVPPGSAISVTDIFGRDVTQGGVTLVDWEGPVRNPAMKYYLKGDSSLNFPLSVRLSTTIENTSFNLPSTFSSNGATKTLLLNSSEALDSFLFSYYMDENYQDETFNLTLGYNQSGLPVQQQIPVKVIDQDYDRPLSYPVIVDYSEAVHPLMTSAETQAVINQAAEDWLYYIDGQDIDEIPIGGSTFEAGGQDHFFDVKTLTNPVPYKGYYLYAYGNSNSGPCVCSTGFPNRELLQTNNGQEVPIFRIGGLHLNIFGQAFETEPTGWEVVSPYDNWTQEGYVGTDMYTLAKHEIGHAMVFENSPLFLLAQGRDPSNPYPDESLMPPPNGFTSPAITAYYPDGVVPLFKNSLSHVIDVLDPASLLPPYGGGVPQPIMPGGREMLTKLDILIMESVGYPLRENEVTKALSLDSEDTFTGNLGSEFQAHLIPDGGIPVYDFKLVNGVLPKGLSLDRRTGKISGTPEEEGQFPVSFQVKDYDERSLGAIFDYTICIGCNTIGSCNNSTDLNGTLTNGTHHYSIVLNSSGKVNNGLSVRLKSQVGIQLNNDFTVNNGGLLEAYIAICN